MLSDQQTSDLVALYHVEAEGEAFFSALLRAWKSSDVCFKLALMIQMESETKAHIRSCLTGHGLFVADDIQAMHRGQAKASQYNDMPWLDFVRSLQGDVYIYTNLCREIARRGAPTAMTALAAVVAHEEAFLSFCSMELSHLHNTSVEPLMAYLHFQPYAGPNHPPLSK
ncbi:hypothetical protein [Burkholderia cepacia]|uniref:hypothetical protein n=1 Tax=Burkholderia cepacia TaxID=292 RepID=UPI001CF172A3|nr:hypothetical protein [Burkholderia cepacia]MCA8031278.1 hypothetical protein [Burkholderia cepacia]